jgi:hypothetical protein
MSFILICTFGNTRVFLKVYKYVDFIYNVVQYNIFLFHRLLVGSVVIHSKFSRKDHKSITRNYDQDGVEIT